MMLGANVSEGTINDLGRTCLSETGCDSPMVPFVLQPGVVTDSGGHLVAPGRWGGEPKMKIARWNPPRAVLYGAVGA
jgi:hypothetical protein